MFKQERLGVVIYGLYLITDIAFVFLSFYLPYIIRWNIFFNWGGDASYIFSWRGILFPSFEQYYRLYIFWGIITILFLHTQHLYRTNRLFSIAQETKSVLRAVLYSTLIAGLVVFFIKAIYISRLVFIGNFVSLCITLSLWRGIKKLILRRIILKGYKNFNVLIIGSGKVAEELLSEIQRNPYLGLNIVGFLDDDKEKGTSVANYTVLGKTTDFERIVRQNFVDEVLITIPHERRKITNLLQLGRELNVSIRVIPDPFELSIEALNVYSIGNLPVLDYSVKELHGADLFGKRVMDIILSGLCLVLFLPLFIILSIAIKISDGGPVLYISQRYGRKGRPFKFYKFRSMVLNADSMLESLRNKNEKSGPIFKIKNDPRISSKLGRFMRKYSIDELLQLWNVLKGDMSVVGPRPLPLDQVEKHDFAQLKRLEIKPGLTGLWQIRGRGDTSFHQLVEWDIWYINNWSFWLDLSIILRTFPAVLKGKGAY